MPRLAPRADDRCQAGSVPYGPASRSSNGFLRSRAPAVRHAGEPSLPMTAVAGNARANRVGARRPGHGPHGGVRPDGGRARHSSPCGRAGSGVSSCQTRRRKGVPPDSAGGAHRLVDWRRAPGQPKPPARDFGRGELGLPGWRLAQLLRSVAWLIAPRDRQGMPRAGGDAGSSQASRAEAGKRNGVRSPSPAGAQSRHDFVGQSATNNAPAVVQHDSMLRAGEKQTEMFGSIAFDSCLPALRD